MDKNKYDEIKEMSTQFTIVVLIYGIAVALIFIYGPELLKRIVTYCCIGIFILWLPLIALYFYGRWRYG